MTPEQIAALVATEVEKANAKMLAELAAVREQDRAAAVADLDKRFAALKPAEPVEPKPGKGQQGNAAAESPEVTQLREAIARMEKERADEKAQSAAIAKAAREKETEATLSNLLQQGGVRPDALRGAQLLVRHDYLAEKDDGSIVFRGTHPISKLPAEFPLEDGVKQWLTTEAAAAYKAPRNVSGAGDRAGRPAANGQRAFASVDDFFKNTGL